MNSHREWNLASKVYIGNLGNNASKYEIEDVFNKYGKLKNVWVARNPPGFAFVEFEDQRDAEDAVKALDGTRICGERATVEMSSGRSRKREGDKDSNGRGFGGRGGGRDKYSGRGSYRDDRDRGGYGGDKDRSRSRSRDRGYGRGGAPARRRNPSRTPSRSDSRERSYSRDRLD